MGYTFGQALKIKSLLASQLDKSETSKTTSILKGRIRDSKYPLTFIVDLKVKHLSGAPSKVSFRHHGGGRWQR